MRPGANEQTGPQADPQPNGTPEQETLSQREAERQAWARAELGRQEQAQQTLAQATAADQASEAIAGAPRRREVPAWLWVAIGVFSPVCILASLLVLAPLLFELVRAPAPPATATRNPAQETTFAPGTTRRRPADGMLMVYVPAGDFVMGSPETEGEDQERPQRRVYLDAFWIDRTEVTNAQYRACMEAGVCDRPKCGQPAGFGAPDQPVVCVSWNQAYTYCRWVGARLPSEAEWEKAARGVSGRRYPWGDQPPTCDLAILSDESGLGCGRGSPWPVGSRPAGASPYGALDMAGNVWEWVADSYLSDYYSQAPQRNPPGPDFGIGHVVRGGSYLNLASALRSASRLGNPALNAYDSLGYRCAASSPPESGSAVSP